MAKQDRVKYQEHIENLKQQLLVPLEQITASSLLDLNIDENKLIYAAINAQKLYLTPVIGSALVRRLQSKPLPYAYQLLMDNFLGDAIINWAVAESVQGIAFNAAQGGMYKHVASDSENASNSETRTIRQSYLNKADTFALQAVTFLKKNSAHYPEFLENSADGLNANKTQMYTGGLFIEKTRNNYGVLDGVKQDVNGVGGIDGVGGINNPIKSGGACNMSQVGNADESIFEATVSWGSVTDSVPGFDLETLSNQAALLPSYVTAQPVDEYFWMVSTRKFTITQFGTPLPMDPYGDETPESAAYVDGNYGVPVAAGEFITYYFVRIKMIGLYTQPVTFGVSPGIL